MLATGLKTVGVIGAGSWGTALANLLAAKGLEVDLWVFEQDLCAEMQQRWENTWYLPGVPLDKNIRPHTGLQSVVEGKQLLLMAVPSHVYRQVAENMLPLLADPVVIVSATKGIENDTLLTMSGIWQQLLGHRGGWHYVVLSGPSFAREVVRRAPTAVTVAAADKEIAGGVQRLFATPFFRPYSSTDVIGVELGGALKNVIALAAGIVDGLGLGHNTRAALITRGLAEMSRLGTTMGADPLTFLGLAGVGDLVLTCTGDLSRNRSVGLELGKGRKLEEILADMRMVAEGVKTARSAYALAQRQGVELPIFEQVYKILYEGQVPEVAVQELMQREPKHEPDTFVLPSTL